MNQNASQSTREDADRFAHKKRRAALEDAMRHGTLWTIVKAQFALDVESMFDGLLRQVSKPISADPNQRSV